MENEEEYKSRQHQFPTSSRGEVDEDDGKVDADEYEVEKFKVDGKHFSHGHPLALTISNEEEKEEDENEDDEFCRICRLPILSSPSYTCTKSNNACKFFLHQQCALKLPPKMIHPAHGPTFDDKHILEMELPPSSSTSLTPATYKCEDCNFKMHPLVAVCGVEIKIKHKSHPPHEMVAVCKVISCECDGCGKTHQGFFFSCQDCNFWIHQDCTILANVITFKTCPYPFILAYSLPAYQIDSDCVVCDEPLVVRHNGVYFSPHSIRFAHVACAKEKFAFKTRRLELMQLPDDEWGPASAFPSSVIRRYAASKPLDPVAYYFSSGDDGPYADYCGGGGGGESSDDDDGPDADYSGGGGGGGGESSDDDDGPDADYSGGGGGESSDDDDGKKLTIEKYHKHPLILVTDHDDVSSKLACDLCTQPILPIEISMLPSPTPILFYRCGGNGNDEDCDFAAHKICADTLPILKFFIPNPSPDRSDLARHEPDVSSYMFNSIFLCSFCYRPCNGLCYEIPDMEEYRDNMHFFIDLECMAAPATVKHASHPRHILFRTHRLSANPTPLTCCPRDSLIYDVYRCITCDHFIHISCAMLPKRILFLEYHHHPLHLLFSTSPSTTTTTITSNDICFCEVCEQDIDLNYWLYRCFECDQSFHINCIPSVGYLSKVKFGGTVSLPKCHVHPLRLTRMLTVPTQRCAHCKHIIQGLVDEIAFFCWRCHFWLHFSCAALQTSPQLKLYSHYDAAIREVKEELRAALRSD